DAATPRRTHCRRYSVALPALRPRPAPTPHPCTPLIRAERGGEREQCRCCVDRGARQADPAPRAPPRSHERAPRPRTGEKEEKEIGDVGGSRSAAPAGRSATRGGGAARSVGTRSLGRRSSRARHPPRTRESPTLVPYATHFRTSVGAVSIGVLAKQTRHLAPRRGLMSARPAREPAKKKKKKSATSAAAGARRQRVGRRRAAAARPGRSAPGRSAGAARALGTPRARARVLHSCPTRRTSELVSVLCRSGCSPSRPGTSRPAAVS